MFSCVVFMLTDRRWKLQTRYNATQARILLTLWTSQLVILHDYMYGHVSWSYTHMNIHCDRRTHSGGTRPRDRQPFELSWRSLWATLTGLMTPESAKKCGLNSNHFIFQLMHKFHASTLKPWQWTLCERKLPVRVLQRHCNCLRQLFYMFTSP